MQYLSKKYSFAKDLDMRNKQKVMILKVTKFLTSPLLVGSLKTKACCKIENRYGRALDVFGCYSNSRIQMNY